MKRDDNENKEKKYYLTMITWIKSKIDARPIYSKFIYPDHVFST